MVSRPDEPMMRCEEFVDLASELHLRRDEDDEEVTDPLDVSDEVRRENDADVVVGDGLHEYLKELTSCERIEARYGLVEEHRLGPLRNRESECQLGALATRKFAGALTRVKTELLNARLSEHSVPVRVRVRAEAKVVEHAETCVERRVLGDETHALELFETLSGAVSEDFN